MLTRVLITALLASSCAAFAQAPTATTTASPSDSKSPQSPCKRQVAQSKTPVEILPPDVTPSNSLIEIAGRCFPISEVLLLQASHAGEGAKSPAASNKTLERQDQHPESQTAERAKQVHLPSSSNQNSQK